MGATKVESIGIIDVHLIKSKRYLFLNPSDANSQLLGYDGLCFAIDRECGTLVYISSSSDSLPFIRMCDEEYNVVRWLKK